MVQKKGKRAVLTSVVILGVLLAVIGGIALVRALGPHSSDPYIQNDSTESTDEQSSDSGSVPAVPNEEEGDETAPAIDPASVSTIDITPMTITVSYTKGVGSFEYEVLRRPNGTRYVEFSSPSLVGTKCTDDKGTFASILESPSAEEVATLAKTTTVDGQQYGLSLASGACTSDEAALKKFQAAFSDPFSLLKRSS